jgi:Flp pilus assembly protein TadG
MLQSRACRLPARCAAGSQSRLRGQRGSTLVEFAAICLVFLAILFGVCEFGMVLYAYHFVSHAAKSATRWAAVNGSTCSTDNSCNGTSPMNCEPVGPNSAADVQAYVTGGGTCKLPGFTPPGIDPTKVQVTASWPAGQAGSPGLCSNTANAPGCPVAVTVCYDYKFIFPLMPVGSSKNCSGSASSGTLTLSSTSEMIIAH